MSCYISVDANGVQTRNYTGDAAIQITSAYGGSTSYVPPACTGSAPHTASHSVPEPATLWLLALGVAALLMSRGRLLHSKPT